MLRIRLQRSGRKNRPSYRIVVAEHSAPIKGRYIEMLGTFDPLVEKHGFVVDTAKVEEWIKKGAKPTNTIARLLKGQDMKGMEPFIIEMKDRAVKNPKKEEAPAAPAAEAATEPSADAPVEEKNEEEAPVEEKKEEVPAEPAKCPKCGGEMTDGHTCPVPEAEEEKKEEEKEEEKKDEAPAEEPKEDEVEKTDEENK